MGIRREELYGPTPGDGSAGSSQAVTPYRAGQTSRVEVPRGTTPTAPLTVPFEARSLLVDNPSASWYRVNGRWIAPWTIGAVVPLDVPAAQLTVQAVTPEGYAIDLVGADLVLVASSEDLPPSPGLFVPNAAPSFLLTAEEEAWTVPQAGDAIAAWIATPPANTRVVLVRLEVSAPLGATVQAEARQLRGMVRVVLADDDGNRLAVAAISPERPSISVEPTGQASEVGAIDLFAEVQTGVGSQLIDVTASYYLQVM